MKKDDASDLARGDSHASETNMALPHLPTKKNNSMNSKIRAGNEYCNAMTTSTAQKRARETGMVTKCAGICSEGKETSEQVRKVRATRKKKVLRYQLF